MLNHQCQQALDNVLIGGKRSDFAPPISSIISLGICIGQTQCCQKICHFAKFAKSEFSQILTVRCKYLPVISWILDVIDADVSKLN